jgi:hypothetical protein
MCPLISRSLDAALFAQGLQVGIDALYGDLGVEAELGRAARRRQLIVACLIAGL